MLETLRALYLGDNDFEVLPAEIGNLKNLQIVSLLPPLTLNFSNNIKKKKKKTLA